jgi:hypothetical protein
METLSDKDIQDGVSFYAFPKDAAVQHTVKLYRLYNLNSDQHFYTVSEAERDSLINHIAGFRGEGHEVYVVPPDSTQFPDSVPLFRWLSVVPDPEQGDLISV